MRRIISSQLALKKRLLLRAKNLIKTFSSGAAVGAGYGLFEGIQAGKGLPAKLKVNRILNHTGRRGSKISNALGACTLIYCGMTNALESFRMQDDVFNHIGAGAGAGLIFKSTAGGKVAVVAAGIGAVVAGGIQGFQEYGPDLPF